ncbi:uncharacterized protein K02A2.6-like [Stomoxys calcitrans]|uniref:uncharacterized protein K02A2.6-like n=1 Tax=Stomoxys calcitrans TaxID=35570 RepID=UPI0027E22775|nr:uncharacterized protein K02A2.6-like [Stomoxys calcitrans]
MIKPNNRITRPPMGEQFRTLRPFQRLYCDFLGPYPCSKSRNCQLFIAVDHFTKFLFLKPMKSATSIGVIDYLHNELFCTFGIPQYIHTDNAKQFTSKEMREFFATYGIRHITTGFYSPQANAAERANREIISKIRYFLRDETNHLNWDRDIPRILTVLRSDVHSGIGTAPYRAVFGQNMILHGSTYDVLEKLDMLNDDTIVEHADRLQAIRDKISHNLDVAHEKASKIYNTRTRHVNFVSGQEVFRKNHSQSNFGKA